GGQGAGPGERGGGVLLALRADAGARQPHRLAHPPRARRVRLGGVARLRRARGARAHRLARAVHPRHRRARRPRALAPRHQPRLPAPAAGHLRGAPGHSALKEGIVLLGHGSKDPEWSQPFEKIAVSLGRRLPAVSVFLAYLEHGPSLDEAVAALVAKGALSIRVI